MRRTSRAHSKGCFAKKFYDLPKANLSHAGECLKNGILPDKLVCLANIGARALSASAQSSQVERKAWLLL